MLLSYVLEAVVYSSKVQHQQHIFTQRIAAHWIFLSFWTILCKENLALATMLSLNFNLQTLSHQVMAM